MAHRLLFAALALAAWGAAAAAELTPMEQRWLQAAQPVVEFARRQGLPMDIVVQPQDAAGLAPLAMGFVDGRCKLVLSMRGNPEAEDTLAGVAPDLVPLVIEAMAAHELGHCWRYVGGTWRALPAGFVDAADNNGTAPELARRLDDMRATRREEGFADLVGLAWTRERHPAQYTHVQAWMARLRADQPVPGSHHDTRAWVALAGDASAFAGSEGLFEQARRLWQRGLRIADD